LVTTLEGIYGAATERSKAVLVSRDPLTNEQRKDGHGDVMGKHGQPLQIGSICLEAKLSLCSF
jgi:hypothetical protein